MKEYEIWIGRYDLGQGYDPSTEPTFIAKVSAINFKVACLKHELERMLEHIKRCEITGEYLDNQSCEWFYNFQTNSNSWTGPYFESKEEAKKSFNT
jgi:hypothetical protein